jgi:hypothetical protein
MSHQVAQFLAKQQITEVLHRYCELVDQGDPALVGDVWHPDAVVHYEGTFDGTATEFMEWIRARRAVNKVMGHFLTNILVDVEGVRATSRCYVVAHIQDEHGTQTVSWGRFTDQWSLREGNWRIDERHHTREFSATTN